MFCKNCGNQLQPGVTVCPYCNTPVQQQPVPPTPMNNQPFQPMPQQPVQPMGQPMGPQPMPMYNQQPVKTKNTALRIILGIVGAVVVIFIILLIIGSINSNKLSCKRNSEKISVRYTDEDIISCTHIGGAAKCDLDALKEYAKAQGVSSTISQLKSELTAEGFTCTE